MNGVGPVNNFANAISPFSPVGKQAVGEENTESKTSTFKPVVESSETNKSENRSDKADPDKLIDRAEQRIVEEKDEQERSNSQARQDNDDEVPEDPNVPALNPQDRGRDVEQQSRLRQLASSGNEDRVDAAGVVASALSVGGGGLAISDDPRANLKQAQAIRREALALADLSPEDRRVAARAVQMEVEARRAIAEQERQERLTEREARIERQEELREDEKRREERADQLTKESQQREQAFNDTRARNLDLNQRLIDIGVQRPPFESGAVVSESV